MRRLALKSALFIGLAYAVTFLYVEYLAMSYSYMDYPIYKAQIDFIQNTTSAAPNPDVLILGDSRALMGIVPKKISAHGRSLGLTGATSVTSYYALTHYLKNHQAPRVIVLSISPVLFERYPDFYPRGIKYKLLTVADAIETLNEAHQLNDFPFEVSPANGNYYWEWLLYKANYLLYYKQEILAGRFYQRWHPNQEIYANLEKENGFMGMPGGSPAHGLDMEADRNTFLASPLLAQYFKKLLDLCSEKNIHVLFQAMPLNDTSFKALKPEYVLGYNNFMQTFQKKYPNVQWHSVLLPFSDEDFADASHLNSRAAVTISEQIKKQLDPTLIGGYGGAKESNTFTNNSQ